MNNYLYSAGIGFNINDITNEDLLFKDSLVDCWVEAQLLGALPRFEAHDDMGDRLAITTERIFGL